MISQFAILNCPTKKNRLTEKMLYKERQRERARVCVAERLSPNRNHCVEQNHSISWPRPVDDDGDGGVGANALLPLAERQYLPCANLNLALCHRITPYVRLLLLKDGSKRHETNTKPHYGKGNRVHAHRCLSGGPDAACCV